MELYQGNSTSCAEDCDHRVDFSSDFCGRLLEPSFQHQVFQNFDLFYKNMKISTSNQIAADISSFGECFAFPQLPLDLLPNCIFPPFLSYLLPLALPKR